MERVNREFADGTRRAIEHSAEATEKAMQMQKELHEQHNLLEAERQAIAAERARDSLLAPVLSTLGVLLACALPLLICLKLLTGLGQNPDDDVHTAILVEELVSDRSVLRDASSTMVLPRLDDAARARVSGLLPR